VIILGCDLSYTRSGLVWVDTSSMITRGCATITLPVGPGRLLRAVKEFHQSVSCFIKPDLAVIEAPIYIANCKTERMLQELQGIMKLTLQAHHIRCLEPQPSPAEIKRDFTGSGKASKCDVAAVLDAAFGIKFEGDCKAGHDLSDACAVACWAAVQIP
jgi:Holliday junction resolvasome RuvABC endonuclease subunit